MDISQLHYHLERKNMEQIIEWWTKPLLKVCENCGAAFSTIKKKQIFCSDECGSAAHDKRKGEQKRERDANMFLVVYGDGPKKRYVRAKKRSEGGFKWVVSKMWASKFTKDDADIVAQQMGMVRL